MCWAALTLSLPQLSRLRPQALSGVTWGSPHWDWCENRGPGVPGGPPSIFLDVGSSRLGAPQESYIWLGA